MQNIVRLVSYAVWTCERNLLLVQHVLENLPSPEQNQPEPLGQTSQVHPCQQLSPQPGQSPVLTELSRFRFNSWLMNFCTVLHCIHNADLACCSTFSIKTFFEPISYSDCWFYHYSPIKTGAKQFTVVRRCMKNVFSLVEWESSSMVNINTMASQQANILSVKGRSSEFMIVLPLTFHYVQDQNKHELHVSVRENFFHILFHFTWNFS